MQRFRNAHILLLVQCGRFDEQLYHVNWGSDQPWSMRIPVEQMIQLQSSKFGKKMYELLVV